MKPAVPCILTINGGSSSIKFAMFEVGDSLGRILEGGIERTGQPEATLRVGGLDTRVFAGGIGEKAPTVRSRICDGLTFLGIELEKREMRPMRA